MPILGLLPMLCICEKLDRCGLAPYLYFEKLLLREAYASSGLNVIVDFDIELNVPSLR